MVWSMTMLHDILQISLESDQHNETALQHQVLHATTQSWRCIVAQIQMFLKVSAWKFDLSQKVILKHYTKLIGFLN